MPHRNKLPFGIRVVGSAIAVCLLVTQAGNAWAQAAASKDIDYSTVLEIGGAGDWEPGSGHLHSGGTIAVEFAAIKDKFELEIGIAAIRADGGLEIPIDVLFKKPYRISPHVEFMFGVGPEIVRVTGTDNNGTFGGGEAVLDFMFWPHGNIGFFVEPSYGFVFRNGIEHGAGGTAGILIGW